MVPRDSSSFESQLRKSWLTGTGQIQVSLGSDVLTMKYFLTVNSDPAGESWLTLRALLESMAIFSESIEMEFEYFGQHTNIMPFASVQGNLTPGTEATLHHHCYDPLLCTPNEQKDVIHLRGLKGRWWWLWFQFFETWCHVYPWLYWNCEDQAGLGLTGHWPHVFFLLCVTYAPWTVSFYRMLSRKAAMLQGEVGWATCAPLLCRAPWQRASPHLKWRDEGAEP